MSTEAAPSPVADRTDDGPDLIHMFCCRPWRALCGERVGGRSLGYFYPDTPDDCLVCDDLAQLPTCGVPGCQVWSSVRRWWGTRRSR